MAKYWSERFYIHMEWFRRKRSPLVCSQTRQYWQDRLQRQSWHKIQLSCSSQFINQLLFNAILTKNSNIFVLICSSLVFTDPTTHPHPCTVNKELDLFINSAKSKSLYEHWYFDIHFRKLLTTGYRYFFINNVRYPTSGEGVSQNCFQGFSRGKI